MARKGLEMPALWYQMPTYTNRNVYGTADPGEDVHWPLYSKKLVIGRKGRNIKAADALKYVAGLTIYNDFSARDVQADEGRIGAGAGKSKDFDQGNVLGPCIVTADEILDPQNLKLETRINGDLRQSSSTAEMIWTCAELIHFFSSSLSFVFLEPSGMCSTPIGFQLRTVFQK